MNVRDSRAVFELDRRAVARAFDRASASYDAAAALQERVRNELLERLGDPTAKPQTILDLGAGTGHAARALKRKYPHAIVVAVDIATGMLEHAKQQSRWLRRFERVRADAYALPFADGTFDTVVACLVFEHIRDVDDAIADIPGVVGIAGVGPTIVDYINAVYKNFPYSLGLIALVTFVLLVRTFRSILLPLKAVLLNVLAVAAAYGVLVLVFQALIGAGLLGVVGALLAIPTAAAVLMLTKEIFIKRQDAR